MKKLWNRLRSTNIIVLLGVSLVVLVILNFLVGRNGILTSGGNSPTADSPGLTFGPEGESGSSEQQGEVINSLQFVDTTKKEATLIDAMPYYSDGFNVVYYYQDDKFLVYMNPASTITQEDIIDWFNSFPKIDASALTIEFVDPFQSSAPVN